MAYEILWRVHAFLMTTAFISMVAAVLNLTHLEKEEVEV